jgi:hypothetical protein
MGRNGIGVAFEPLDDAPENVVVSELGNVFRLGAAARSQNRLATLVDGVVEAEVRIGEATARRARAIEDARRFAEDSVPAGAPKPSREMARRGFVCEIAAALRIPDRTAQKLIETSKALVHDLPSTLEALGEGRLSYRHAQILVDQSYGLDKETVRELETRMIPVAERNTASRFEQSVRRTRERLNPETIVERQVAAVEERTVLLELAQDGMAWINHHVTAVQGVAIYGLLTDIARSMQVEGETRTLDQLRSDVLSDLILNVDDRFATVPGFGDALLDRLRSIRPKVLVTVPALTLAGKGKPSDLAELEGYGPIDPETAKILVGNSKTMQRILTDPVTGVVLKLDRKRYRIPKDLRTWLRVRDGTCRFPGCNRQAGQTEIDHTDDWALGGGTNHDNLACLCKKHHALKGASDWKVKQVGGGILDWTSPAGFHYVTYPAVDYQNVPTAPLDDLIRECHDNDRYIDAGDIEVRDFAARDLPDPWAA